MEEGDIRTNVLAGVRSAKKVGRVARDDKTLAMGHVFRDPNHRRLVVADKVLQAVKRSDEGLLTGKLSPSINHFMHMLRHLAGRGCQSDSLSAVGTPKAHLGPNKADQEIEALDVAVELYGGSTCLIKNVIIRV
jgi:hypothetical protein